MKKLVIALALILSLVMSGCATPPATSIIRSQSIDSDIEMLAGQLYYPGVLMRIPTRSFFGIPCQAGSITPLEYTLVVVMPTAR
jgi:hypothetical protein